MLSVNKNIFFFMGQLKKKKNQLLYYSKQFPGLNKSTQSDPAQDHAS